MKNLKSIVGHLVIGTFAVIPLASHAEASTNAPEKIYPLKTCLVCDMQLGMMGRPCVFVYKGQEIKVCNKSEKADFDKAPGKFLKKIAAAKLKN